MSQVVEIQLEWKYTPKNYLEEAIQVEEAGYTLFDFQWNSFSKNRFIFL